MPDLIPFNVAKRRLRSASEVAKHYRLVANADPTRLSPEFLHKAAIFQEIRDSLAEAEAGLISDAEAEARVSFFSKLYLYGGQSG